MWGINAEGHEESETDEDQNVGAYQIDNLAEKVRGIRSYTLG